mgnify:CR=1 FL=1
MGNNRFTKEEIDYLSKNEYVLKVNEYQVVFTDEFKELCVRQSNQGMTPKEIFDNAGIGYHLIGTKRARNNVYRFKEQSQRMEGFNRIKGSGRPKNIEFKSIEDELQYYKDKTEYLKQENEFLKKLKALERRYK